MNAPSTFQRLIDTLFGPEMQPNVFGYLDDIVIATESFENRLYWIEMVLKELLGAGLEVNREKCEFWCSQVSYLGFLLDREGLIRRNWRCSGVPCAKECEAASAVSGDARVVLEIYKG